jgi:hypothetical protein
VSPSRDDQPRSTRRLGRRLALALYFACIGYLAVIGFISVIPQVFFPAPTVAEVPDCAALRDELSFDLRATAGRYVETGGASTLDLDAFLTAWDARYRGLSEHCHDDPTISLGELRYRLETTLRRYGREEAPLVRTLSPHRAP